MSHGNQKNCCSHETPQVLTRELGVDPCQYLNLVNFLSVHQLMHSCDFHDVLCRLDSRTNRDRVVHRQNWARVVSDLTLKLVDVLFLFMSEQISLDKLSSDDEHDINIL